MTYLLNASACPPVAGWDAFPLAPGGNLVGIAAAYATGPTAPVSRGFLLGASQAPFLRGQLNANAAAADLGARFGGGVYAVAWGLALSAGAGLTASVAPGFALMDGPLEVPAALSVAVAASSVSWVWLLRPAPGATPTLFASAALAPPSAPAVLLGNVTSGPSGVTAVDYSGVLVRRGAGAFRQTADAGAPADAPPATAAFTAITAGGVYDWTGAAYVQKLTPRTVLALPARSVTVTALGVNDRLGVDFSGAGSFGSANYRVLSCLCSDPAVIVAENLGPKTAGKVFFTVYQPPSDTGGAFTLTVTLEGSGFTPNPAPTAPVWDNPAAIG